MAWRADNPGQSGRAVRNAEQSLYARERSLTEMILLVTQTLGNPDREDDQVTERWFADHAHCDLVQNLGRSTELLVNRLQVLLRHS